MNNSFLPNEEQKPDYTERAGKLATLIEAVEALLSSPEWSTLKTEEFDGEQERMERLLVSEAKKPILNVEEIYRLQGKLEILKRYNLSHLRDKYRLELDGIKRMH